MNTSTKLSIIALATLSLGVVALAGCDTDTNRAQSPAEVQAASLELSPPAESANRAERAAPASHLCQPSSGYQCDGGVGEANSGASTCPYLEEEANSGASPCPFLAAHPEVAGRCDAGPSHDLPRYH